MVNYNATNVALYVLGGSGDNLIPNGYVKAVEKVWIDSYVYSTASTALLTTADTVLIGYVPAGAKVVGVEVMLPVGFAPTNATINVGMSYSTSLFITSATSYIAGAVSTGTVIYNKVTMNNPLGQNFVPTSSTSTVSGGTILTQTIQGVYLSIGVAAITVPTAGTIQTIIRYT